jgi:anti-anti-sigma factor
MKPTGPGDFGIQEHGQDDHHTLVLAGELDLASAQALEKTVLRLCTEGASEVVLDLSQLAFVDSTGLRTILTSRKLCAKHRCAFWLIPGQKAVQRMFELAGLIDTLPFRAPGRAQAAGGGNGAISSLRESVAER